MMRERFGARTDGETVVKACSGAIDLDLDQVLRKVISASNSATFRKPSECFAS